MKINWGMGLAICLGVFAVVMLFFVIRIVTQEKFNHDLVTEHYYEKEMLLQKEIDGVENAKKLSSNIQDHKAEEGYLLIFPADLDPKKIRGIVSFYRPSNKALDFEIPLKLTVNELSIPYEKLVSGRWNVSIFWKYGNEDYYFEKKLIF